jgi:endo-1,4-beta-D-glucanase Y
VTYADGVLLPSPAASERDEAVTRLYDGWKERFVSDECGGDQYIVRTELAGGDSTITVSEAHGYGMLLAAYMAGHDPDARRLFDGFYEYFRAHPSVLSDDLMAWNQVAGCLDVDGDETNSATDGDLDIAYALLLADAQWGSEGDIDYREQAIAVIAAIQDHEIIADPGVMALGDWVSPDDETYGDATRSSDFMPAHFRAFAAASDDDTWTEVLDASYTLLSAIQGDFAAETGLLPDFIEDVGGVAHPAGAGFLEGETDGWYAYNACRDPWRIGVDYLVAGEARAAAILAPLNAFVYADAEGDPGAIAATYQLDGTRVQEYTDMAFVAPLAVGAMASNDQEWLDALWRFVVAHPLEDEVYYGATLKLLALVALSGNWWQP